MLALLAFIWITVPNVRRFLYKIAKHFDPTIKDPDEDNSWFNEQNI